MIYDIAALRRKVIAMYPFFGSVAANIEYRETEGVPSITSDERSISYDPQYMAGLSDNDQVFVLARELCHVAFRHRARGKGKDPAIWQTATEAIINQMLKRDGLDIIRGGVDYPEAADYDAEQYYELLLSERLDIDLTDGQLEGQENPAGGNSDSGQGNSDDEQESDDDDGDDDGSDELYTSLLPEKNSDDDDPEDDDQALIEDTESDAGNDINRDTRAVEDIGRLAPLLDWRLLLLDTISYGVDWSYRNAILEDGIVRSVLEEKPFPETEIVLDTSWSVDEELLRSFLRECKNILPLSKLRAGCFDTEFYGFHDIRTEKDIDDMIFQGGGGTDFNAAVDAFTMRVDNRIIFTDGQAPMPDRPLKAIWVVCGEEEIAPDGGIVIHIKPEQLL